MDARPSSPRGPTRRSNSTWSWPVKCCNGHRRPHWNGGKVNQQDLVNGQPTPKVPYPIQKQWFYEALLRETNWLTRCWQLKYVFVFTAPGKLGKMNPFWRSYFSNGLVQPPTDKTWWMEGSDILGNIGSDLERIIPRYPQVSIMLEMVVGCWRELLIMLHPLRLT